jgi:trans-aconitate methyltransferase
MTILLAKTFPDAAVIGVDKSPVPVLHEKPANVTFIQRNIKDLLNED